MALNPDATTGAFEPERWAHHRLLQLAFPPEHPEYVPDAELRRLNFMFKLAGRIGKELGVFIAPFELPQTDLNAVLIRSCLQEISGIGCKLHAELTGRTPSTKVADVGQLFSDFDQQMTLLMTSIGAFFATHPIPVGEGGKENHLATRFLHVSAALVELRTLFARYRGLFHDAPRVVDGRDLATAV